MKSWKTIQVKEVGNYAVHFAIILIRSLTFDLKVSLLINCPFFIYLGFFHILIL
jgi:hypothetical protein